MDLGARVPSIAHAGDITVSQVGLGALGAPLALELARNQFGTLRLLESDFVEVAQTVRWPIGIPAAGFSKLQMVNSYIELNYPFVSVEQYAMRLGEAFVRHTRAETQIDALERFVDGSDLVIDASAEHDVQSVISDFARSSQTAQIYLSATNGARGGQITYINPNAGGCWMCWRYAQSDNADIIPDGEPSDLVQPRGCAAPTFTGTSFDLLPISAQAARVASAVTAPGSSKSSTLWLCSIEGDASAPLWTEHDVDVHPLCPFCSPK
jgi:molybdopterin/thiamine biosynthesis adenylyltransferase